MKADLNARSPWAALNDVHQVEISPATQPITGEIAVPGSKSFTNRALILAAMAAGVTKLSGLLKSDDSYWCIDALKRIGVDVKMNDDDTVEIEGSGGDWPNQTGDLYIGASGTVGRFLPGALAASPAGKWKLEASERMSQRPVEPLIEGLSALGANVTYLGEKGFYPLEVEGTGLNGGEVRISGKVSSQFISGLLMAAPYARKPVTIRIVDHIVQHAYVNITLDLMKQFGIHVEADDDLTKMVVQPGKYVGRPLQLEADASTSCYFLAAAAITGGKIRITNLSAGTRQPDILLTDVLEEMGCRVTKGKDYVELEGPNTAVLKGNKTFSMKEMSDQALTLAAVSVFADDPVTITDVEHIRHHESDRIHAICESFERLGIRCEEFRDGLTVYPGAPKAAELPSYDDHRVAMSLSLIGLRTEGIRIDDPGCVSKTCPNYFQLLEELGVNVHFS
ncbi:MAG TPA: 3-phosphoshikimate 1-carboxyvinyltransferase [Bacillales bacterium]|nr:3-phosphoshikimate 1-carboxyvinyltransferase [Bacillales bacterium]